MRDAEMDQIRTDLVNDMRRRVVAAEPGITAEDTDRAIGVLMSVWDQAMEMSFKSTMDTVSLLHKTAADPRYHAQASGLMLAADILRATVEGSV